MFRSGLVLVTGVVIFMSGCSGLGTDKRGDDVSPGDGTSSHTTRSTKHGSKTPRDVIASPAGKDKNEPKGTALAAKSTKPSPPTPTDEDAELREVAAIVGSDASHRGYANEDVVSVGTAKVARQPVIDLDQLDVAPLTKRATPSIPEQPRAYTFGPTKPGSTLADVANQLLPSARVTIAQMMWALYQKNPEAFTNKNINSLKPSSLLSVPDLEELLAISRTEAEAQITRLRGSVKTKVSAAY